MATDEAKQIYKQRGATAETVNAAARRGLCATSLRASPSGACLFVLAYNILRLVALTT